ncbi:MAG: hypothetical protein FWE49_06235 [Synergistaceae bacterium]|nr:hypothetical protein [Synergistaceae bacterium]
MFKRIVITLIVIAAASAAILFFITENSLILTEYNLGDDMVASINAVIGEERKVTGVANGTSNGLRYIQYTYESASKMKDLTAYSTYLQKNGWIITQSYDFADERGAAQFATNSVESGKILAISIAFEADKYSIRFNKFEGELKLK